MLMRLFERLARASSIRLFNILMRKGLSIVQMSMQH